MLVKLTTGEEPQHTTTTTTIASPVDEDEIVKTNQYLLGAISLKFYVQLLCEIDPWTNKASRLYNIFTSLQFRRK